MKKGLNYSFFVFLLLLFFGVKARAQSNDYKQSQNKIDLAGKWYFQVDSLDKGIDQQWFKKKLTDKIQLPGSMTTNGKGDDITVKTPWTGDIIDTSWFYKPEYLPYRQKGNIKVPFWLQPDKYYRGAAWYQKIVNIPGLWTGKHVELSIERSHWETTVWVDDKRIGMQNSLSTAQIFDLTGSLTTGKHVITIRVDNRIKDINFGPNSHSISDHTQTNWNGLIGQLFIRSRPSVYLDNVQLFPDIKNKLVLVKIQLANPVAKNAVVKIDLNAISNYHKAAFLKPFTKTVSIKGKVATVEITYPMGKDPLLWSEFYPSLYHIKVKVTIGKEQEEQKEITFGMREFSANGTQFTINGQPTFLRGALECASFPKTGYPPTDVGSWIREFKMCRSYGLNHLRFHSWCPPEAAFIAADSLGFYLQIECASWANQGATIGDGKPLDKYIYEESRRIVNAYGNHPSFCMLAYGNEPAGSNLVKYLTDFVTYWKARDSRRLYTTGAGWPLITENDYNSTPDPRIQHWGEGLKSIINSQKPAGDYDWSSVIEKWQHPTVSHEIGQWCVYPDFKEISRYDGVLKAKNFEIFKDNLEKNGMLNMAEDFLFASGKLQVLCYKADIEAALRTKGFGGFQLLGLSDFPGQGTALVGVLNPFWEEKSYITGPAYSQFCNAVVPLARLPKMIYLNNEELNVPVEVAQFGPEVLKSVISTWDIRTDQGEVIFKGVFDKKDIPFGNGNLLGVIKQPLTSINKPSRLILTVNLDKYKNSWDIFVYPKTLPHAIDGIMITQKLDDKALEILSKGGKVLLTLKKGSLKADKGGDIAIGFSSIFWNTAWTNSQPPVTMGILCDPKHSAFEHFPTQKFSNWQWWDAMSHSNAIKLDSIAKGLQPIVRVIDDWVTARSLGLIFECRVGKGKLIVSGIDLLTDQNQRPEARQLLYSLESYMDKDEFSPKTNVDIQKIRLLYN